MDDKLTELMALLQPDDPHQLTAADLARLHQLIQAGQVNAAQLSALYRVQPAAAQMQVAAQQKVNDRTSVMLNNLGAAQIHSLRTLHHVMTSLTATAARLADQIGDKPATAAALANISLQFAGTAGQLTERLEAINHHNNQTWARLIATTVISGVGVATMTAAYLLNREARP